MYRRYTLGMTISEILHSLECDACSSSNFTNMKSFKSVIFAPFMSSLTRSSVVSHILFILSVSATGTSISKVDSCFDSSFNITQGRKIYSV